MASLSTLESQVASLEAEKARLEAVEVSLRNEVDNVKRDKMEVVLKFVPYATMELIHNDDLGSLVGRLVSSTIFYEMCKAFEQVAGMKEPFDLLKVKGYRTSYKKDPNQAGNDLATATFPWRAFWSLNEDILKITILKTTMPYPSRKIRRICACTHQRPQRRLVQYAVSSEDQYVVLEI
ncbi:hypothetical protein Tco_1047814 [Tanacetum coccineum]